MIGRRLLVLTGLLTACVPRPDDTAKETDGRIDTGSSDTGDSTEDSDSKTEAHTGDSPADTSDSTTDSDSASDSDEDSGDETAPDSGGDSDSVGTADTADDTDSAEDNDTARDTDTGASSDSGADTADSSADTSVEPADEEPGNGLDDDGDGVIDELPDSLDHFDFLAVSSGPATGSGGYTVFWAPELGMVGVLDSTSFLAADITSTHSVAFGDIDDNGASWVGDLDGDGYSDLAAGAAGFGGGGFVFAWSDVTSRDVTLSDAIARFEYSGGIIDYLWRGTDGTGADSLVWYQESPGLLIYLPLSALSDGVGDATEATGTIEGFAPVWNLDGPAGDADFDGDGIADALLTEDTTRSSLLRWSGSDLGSTTLSSADATWSFDVTDRDPDAQVWLATTADLNADGYSDLVGWGAIQDATTNCNCSIFSILGPTTGTSTWSDATTTMALPVDAGLGDLATLGDVDGDGAADVAVAVRPEDRAGTQPGHLDILLASTLAAGGTADPEVDRWAVVDGHCVDDYFGVDLYPADYDNDGTIDLATYSSESCRDSTGTITSYYGTDIFYGLGTAP